MAEARVKANERLRVTPPRPARWEAVVRLASGVLAVWLAGAGVVAAQDTHGEAIRAGDSAWQERRFGVARDAYLKALGLDSVASSRAVFRVAVLYSWDGDLVRALPLFTRYTRLEPRDEEGRVALARAYAWDGQTGPAVAIYDSILGRDSTYRDAALGAAQALAWAGRFRESLGRYEGWLRDHGTDLDASLARARTLGWAGRLKAAEIEYQRLSEGGARADAARGAALVAGWRGDLFRSEGMWRAVVARFPNDVEAWVGLAQVLRWSGRPDEASDALDRAVAVDPDNAEARAERRWVAADLAAALAPTALATWDSDGNRSEILGARAFLRPARRTALTVSASHRWAALDPVRGTSDAARASLRVSPERRLSVTGDVGLVRTRGERGISVIDRSKAVGSVAATLKVSSRGTIGMTAARDVFDETAPLILSGIEVATVGVDGEVELGKGAVLAVGGHRAGLSGGSVDNVRRAVYGTLRWRPRRALTLSVAGRTLGYDASPRDGYFSPRRYRQGEVAARWAPGRELGWGGFLEGALGSQFVRFGDPGDSRPTQRVGVGMFYRPGPGSEVSLDYGFSNVAGAGSITNVAGSIYQAQVVSLRVRIRL